MHSGVHYPLKKFIPLNPEYTAGGAHLEVTGHEDAHYCKAAEAHPDGPAVELPGGALVVSACRGQIRQRCISLGGAHTRCVCYEVRVHLAGCGAAACKITNDVVTCIPVLRDNHVKQHL